MSLGICKAIISHLRLNHHWSLQNHLLLQIPVAQLDSIHVVHFRLLHNSICMGFVSGICMVQMQFLQAVLAMYL